MSDDLIARAAALHQTGDLTGAATIYREVLDRSPQNFDATHMLGVIALQEGKFDVAQRMINAALAMRPNDAAAMVNLGTSYLRDGQLEPALQWFEIAVTLRPDSSAAIENVAQTLYQLGRHRDAIPLLQKACALDSSSYPAHNLLGACLMTTGDEHAAATIFENAINLRPHDAQAWTNLSIALRATGQNERARECASRAEQLQPHSPSAFGVPAGNELQESEADDTGESSHGADALAAPSVDMVLSYAHALLANGLNEAAVEQLKRGLVLAPNNLTIRWAIAMAPLKTIYQSESEVTASRLTFGQSLDEIKAWYESTPGIETPYRTVGTVQPFLLAYQHYNNRELLRRYGKLCATFMATLPEGAARALKRQLGAAPAHAGRKLRLGVVSAHIREHSIWTAITKGWLAHLDRSKFEIFVFHLSPTVDGETEVLMQSVRHFDNQPKGISDWADAISGADLDVILYPEIGIEPFTARLAAMRLAPVQAVSWGHPETSGLPTIDLFLSAQAFEPSGAAENNYSEALVQLPHLGIYVEPLALPHAEVDLGSLQLPADQALLLCPGQPFKYAPQYDDIWVRSLKDCRSDLFSARAAPVGWCFSEARTKPGIASSRHGCAQPLPAGESTSMRT